jgi:hypothetical protein
MMPKKWKILIWIVFVTSLFLATQPVFAGDCPPSKTMPPPPSPPSPPSPPAAPVAPEEPEEEPNQEPPKEKEFEVSEGQKADFNLGNSGVYLPSAAPGVKVFIHKMPLGTLKREIHYLLNDAVKVEMFDQDGNTLQQGNAYIYFNLDKSDLAAWKEGRLAVFKYDPDKNSFTRQNSYSVDAGKHGRVAALVSEPGIYVLRKEISLSTEVLQDYLTDSETDQQDESENKSLQLPSDDSYPTKPAQNSG